VSPKIFDAMELIETKPNVSVQEPEFKRLLGYPRQHILEGRALELSKWVRQWYAEHGRPWIYARQTDGLEFSNDRLKVNGTEFSSKLLHDQFHATQAHGAMLVVVSAGKECEEKARELWQAGKPDEYFFMEMYGSAVVEHLVTVASGRICGWADHQKMVALPHYSPGYSGWDVSDQNRLWDLIRQNNGHHFPGELHVLDTGMLRPKKSLLTIFGLTRHLDKVQRHLVPCENCSLPGCQYRRASYKNSLPQVEDVRRLQNGRPENLNGRNSHPLALTPDAKYSINARALRKWSQERLTLKTLPDRSVEAQFRYEGTTCSNMGLPLEFHYRIKLSAPGDGYRITEALCIPAPGDTGHTQQCDYINNATALMGSIADEKPLLGRPLNDVLTWERPANPSGCYCDVERRTHKWGLVYEVIHYALVQHEQQVSNGQPAAILK
jgi:hypothetical protein